MKALGEGLWVEHRAQRFWGVETGTRTTIVRLSDGGLFVHSPVSLDAELERAVNELGPVVAIVAPSLFHHLYVGEWVRAYPDASVSCCPGLEHKRADLTWDRVLGDRAPDQWSDDVDQVHFGARALENEVVFFHRASRSMITADAIFNLKGHPSRVTRLAARLIGNREPGSTYLERIMMRKARDAAREQVDRMLAWDIERIVLAHGDLVTTGGHDVLRRAYRWL